MSRAGWMAFAASFLLVPAQTPAQTPTQLPSPTAVSDSTRADLIERVARSIIHVRGTLDGAPVTSELILQRRIAAAPVGTAFTLSVKSADAVKSVTVTSIAKDDTPDIAADLNGYAPPPPD
jgi:hypothetical protein